MSNQQQSTKAEKFFSLVTGWPKTIMIIALLIIITSAGFIPTIVKDTRSDAFMPPDHPALVYQKKSEEIFGLKDPMVIAITSDKPTGIFTPESLALVERLTEQIKNINNIDADRVTSLATENDIIGTEYGMEVEAFFEQAPVTQQQADAVRTAVMDFPLYLGSLVARDGSATLIVAELIDQNDAQAVYQDLLTLVDSIKTPDGINIVVAGEGAVSGYMGAYIDSDATRLNPIAGLIITIILFIAFRTWRATIIPNIVVLGTVASALGVMAGFGVPFFVITNALPVVLIGIAVADSIHIFSQYYEEAAENPNDSSRAVVIRTMVHMWRPVTLTTFTTMAGFLGLSISAGMPPMQYFGLFAMLGVAVAWMFSLTVVPAALSMMKLHTSRNFKPEKKNDIYAVVMSSLGRGVIRYPITVLVLAGIITITGIFGASKLILNEDRIATFQDDERIVLADTVINARFDGVHYLDIVVETPQAEDLFKPENLKRIEDLQTYANTLPHVNGSTSIVDYLKQMNRALHEDKKAAYQIPNDADLIAQYFLLYSASGDPDDFEEEVDYDYRLANVRIRMDSGEYQDQVIVVENVERYLQSTFNATEITGNLSGRVNVDYNWIKNLGENHAASVIISLLLVWAMASLSLRSMVAGFFTLTPVALSILLIYAVMGYTGIWLAIGTSMFAAIAIGLGVDFAVHTIERLMVLIKDKGHSIDEAISKLYPSTGRALFFNFLALALGFGVLISSEVVPLIRFGTLVAVAVFVSFLASMTVLPALIKVIEPNFVKPKDTLKALKEVTVS
ncbi:MAG: MMPL family transporter [Gammaproteobacteria bacterium]|nr:MMPL family transporter [Gammaproteobacteria bacterium]